MSNLNKGLIRFDDSASIDAFGRARFSSPETIFDSKQLFSKMPLLWTESIVGAATSVHNPNEAATIMTVSASIGDMVTRQTKQYFNYQPGKSHFLLLTSCFGNRVPGISKRKGYFDGYNGLFIEDTGVVTNLIIRSNVSGSPEETVVPQDEWNIDKLDGYGISGITLDITKAQIFLIDFEWLGVGRVRWGFGIDGKIIYVHESLHANNADSVYMSSPNLPIRYEIENVSSGTGSSMKHICSTLFSEGGFNPVGLTFSASRFSLSANNTTILPLISIRKKQNILFRGSMIKLLNLNMMSTTGANLYWAVYFNPTITGGTAASWVSANSESGIEYDISRTGTLSGGVIIAQGFVSNTQDQFNFTFNLREGLGYDLNYIPDEFVIGARSVTQPAETVFGSIIWTELS